jgi:hypothetical protein
MTQSALITMILVLGLVWGGFATLLFHAMRREKQHRRKEKDNNEMAGAGKVTSREKKANNTTTGRKGNDQTHA